MTPLISSDEENWTPPSAVAGDAKRREGKNVISLEPIPTRPPIVSSASVVVKLSFPTKIPRITDLRKKKPLKECAMKFKSAGSDPKLRVHCVVRLKRLSNDEVKQLRYVWIRKII